MKKVFKHIISVVLISYFFLAGSGINVVNYCCDTCRQHGIVDVAENSCGVLHHSTAGCCDSTAHNRENSDDHDLVCSNISHHPNSCHLLRLNVETPTIVGAQFLKFEAHNFQLALPIIIFSFNIFENIYLVEQSEYSPPDTPLAVGRLILTNKSVLLI